MKKLFSQGSQSIVLGGVFPFSQYLLKTDEFSHLKDIPDFMRVLIIWKHTFMNTYLDGKKYFRDRFYLLRHEDLLNDPVTSLSKLYELMGRDVPDKVLEWAKNNINGSKPSFAYNNSRWNKAFRELDMSEALTLAGYDELVPGEEGFWTSVSRRLFG